MGTYNYSYELPKVVATNNEFKYTHLGQESQLILSVFDTDDKKGVLSKQELIEALKFLKKKEKEIAVGGRKGDGFLHEDDFVEILKDKKFEGISYEDVKYKVPKGKEGCVSSSMYDIHIEGAFTALLCGIKGLEHTEGREFFNKSTGKYDYLEVTQITKTKANNKDAYIYDNGSTIHLNNDKNQRYVIPDFVAEKVGLKPHKTWFGWGSTDYYWRKEGRDHSGGGTCRIDYMNVHYNWDTQKHEFIKGEEKSAGHYFQASY